MITIQVALALAFAALYIATFAPLRRLIRSPDRPTWLRKPLNVEYVLLTHMAVLLAALCLLANAVFG
jgi:hypothetical protein